MGGGVGSVVRFLCSQLISKTSFPWATFGVNIVGSLLIGALMAYFTKQQNEVTLSRLFLITGFCGGFTTFSTFSLEVVQYIQKQAYTMAITYALASLVLCILATVLGFFLFK